MQSCNAPELELLPNMRSPSSRSSSLPLLWEEEPSEPADGVPHIERQPVYRDDPPVMIQH